MNIFQDILPYGVFGKSRAINAENPTGEKGKRGWSIVLHTSRIPEEQAYLSLRRSGTFWMETILPLGAIVPLENLAFRRSFAGQTAISFVRKSETR